MIDVLDDLADPDLEAHTSIVLAYNVDLLFYDKLVRRRLASSGAMSQLVFCDATPYAAGLDGVDPGSRIGRAYSVTPVRLSGAFHPKAYMLLGRRKARLIVGSGNSSIGGLVRNAEAFGRFDFDEAKGVPAHPAFSLILDLAKRLAARAVPAVTTQLARAEAWSPWIRSVGPLPDSRVVHVGGEGGAGLISVLRQAVSGEQLKRVVAVSASFDRKLDAVRELAQLGNGAHETIVIVQADRANVDGSAVGHLPRNVRWGEFDDPRPSKKHRPADSYAHAKLYILETEDRDHLFFGSANLSSPALISGANVELLVQAAPEPPGTWLERLGLAKSLVVDARDKLLDRTWQREDEPDAGLIHLAGVEWSPACGWIVALVSAPVAGAELALGDRALRPVQALPLESDGGLLVARASHALEGVRFAWIADHDGKQLSSTVTVTWPEVSRVRVGGWFGSRVEEAILGMKHGDVLGPVLFEFLDRIPDLNALAVGSMLKREKPETGEPDDEEHRSAESFYTDVVAEADDPARLAVGDRSDLDLLASLVQPITVQKVSHRNEKDDDDEEDDDASLAEEAERRALDTKQAPADGSERVPSSKLPSAARMRKAGRRFARRVVRAADSLDETQGAIAKQRLVLPPGLIARQVWMAYIAAFVAGRPVETSDNGEQIVVESDVLAHYVLRCAGALAGDASGGLLRAISPAAWKSRDGATLSDGLRFLIAACAWAVAWFEKRYGTTEWSSDDDQIEAEGLHDAIPLLVLARLIAVLLRVA